LPGKHKRLRTRLCAAASKMNWAWRNVLLFIWGVKLHGVCSFGVVCSFWDQEMCSAA
jgi:hypothetical protein